VRWYKDERGGCKGYDKRGSRVNAAGWGQVLKALGREDNKGEGALEVGDKSSAEEVSQVLGMSKKNFKDAVGLLYRRKMVAVSEHRVQLLPQADWSPEGNQLYAQL
jgi:hypothetical protein